MDVERGVSGIGQQWCFDATLVGTFWMERLAFLERYDVLIAAARLVPGIKSVYTR